MLQNQDLLLRAFPRVAQDRDTEAAGARDSAEQVPSACLPHSMGGPWRCWHRAVTAPLCTTGDKGNPQVSEPRDGSSPAPLEPRDGGQHGIGFRSHLPRTGHCGKPAAQHQGDERLQEERVPAMGAFINHL